MFSLFFSRQESPKTRKRIDDGLTHDPIPSHPILFHLPWDVNLHCYFWSSLVCSADHILSILYIDNPCSFSAVSLSLGGIPLCLMHGQCAWALHTHAPCAREKRKRDREHGTWQIPSPFHMATAGGHSFFLFMMIIFDLGKPWIFSFYMPYLTILYCTYLCEVAVVLREAR